MSIYKENLIRFEYFLNASTIKFNQILALTLILNRVSREADKLLVEPELCTYTWDLKISVFFSLSWLQQLIPLLTSDCSDDIS